MADIRQGWEERYAELPNADFSIRITYSSRLEAALSKAENDDLNDHLDALQDFVHEQARGMLKGVVKYERQERTPKEWQEFADDELVDLVNYRLLRDRAMEVRRDEY